ncbi:hypothetical protein NEOKW01_1265 [Nematocida sp. AWRm80]|nr:hypothetical protein NEOKW01_1265 [Nematocida sp. AWRm80]
MEYITMNNGNRIDILGLGTYETKKEEASTAVSAAMKTGYRLYDTAQVYGNEEQISAAIKETGVPRKDVFITTKISTSNQGYPRAKESVKESLKRMGLEYLDLVLIHWPGVKGLDPKSPENKSLRHQTYQALLELQSEGLVKNIGVSNFMTSHMRGLFETFDKKPQVNQIELSPICYPKDVVSYCQENDVIVQSYSTLGRGLLLQDEWINKYPVLQRLQKKGSISQQILKWSMKKKCIVIPKSITPSRIEDNFKALTVDLSEEDEYDLDNFGTEHRTCWDPYTIS